MDDIRKSIINKHENLKQLEDYEELLEYINNEGSTHWWQIKTPRKEIDIFTNESRKNLKEFIMSEISRIKTELEIKE